MIRTALVVVWKPRVGLGAMRGTIRLGNTKGGRMLQRLLLSQRAKPGEIASSLFEKERVCEKVVIRIVVLCTQLARPIQHPF